MKPSPKVVGLVQARDEWPLLAVSVSHALTYHVHLVYVLNHASTDGTLEGLNHLKNLWEGRIRVVNFGDRGFWQEASTNVLVTLSQEASPDWIYVFDADEFLLTKGLTPLGEILAGVGPEYVAVRYEVENWISLRDFDEANLDHYARLRYRSVPKGSLDLYPEACAEEIGKGNLNFYHVPFPSKVIFRNSGWWWLAAGAHFLKNPVDAPTLRLDPEMVRAAHFPYLVRKRLDQKAAEGEKLVRQGFPPFHGWQNQMMYRLAQENRLDRFWEQHTIGPRTGADNERFENALPTFVVDEDFIQAIGPVLRLLQERLDLAAFQRAAHGDLLPQEATETEIPFRVAVETARTFQAIADSLRSERDKLAAERDRLARAWGISRLLRSVRRFTVDRLRGGSKR